MAGESIVYLDLADAQGLHADAMTRTGYPPAPLRDPGALESAMARPRMLAHYEGADPATQAVVLMLAISQAQAFIDGNKRTAFYAALVFLELNGQTFIGDSELLAVLLEEAATRPQEEARTAIVDWMRPYLAPSEC
jgi:death-on-curing protein